MTNIVTDKFILFSVKFRIFTKYYKSTGGEAPSKSYQWRRKSTKGYTSSYCITAFTGYYKFTEYGWSTTRQDRIKIRSVVIHHPLFYLIPGIFYCNAVLFYERRGNFTSSIIKKKIIFNLFSCIKFIWKVRSALLKSVSVYMSLRGHHNWTRRPSMFSVNFATAADTEAPNCNDINRLKWISYTYINFFSNESFTVF